MTPTSIAGRYTVLRAIGRGGMGTVWLCRDEVLGREVAVKQVGTLPGESTSDVSRALREARTSAALNHRNVVSVHDAVEEDGHNWLVMEYVPSRTLAQILEAEGSVPPERAARIGAQVADGLAAAHARGTVHRDVKPGNILVTDDDHVKITDFGIARTHGEEMVTRTGLVIGTPSYLSPELARGEEPGLASDVWALGATLYAAVEGRPLYPERTNTISLITTIASEPAPAPRQAGPLTGPIGRMLDRDPESRWTMREAAEALHRLQDPAPVPAPSFQDTQVLAPVPALAHPDPDPHDPSDLPDLAELPPETEHRRRRWLLPLVALLTLVLLGAGGYALVERDEDSPPPDAQGAEPGQPATTPEPAAPTPDAEPSEDESAEPPGSSDVPPTEEPTEDAQSTEPAEPTGSGDPAAFVRDYYSLLPGDTESAYALLSPTYRDATSYGSYRGFWTTIGDVSVDDVVATGDDEVVVSLTYTDADGRAQSETRRIVLEQGAEGLAISEDAITTG